MYETSKGLRVKDGDSPDDLIALATGMRIMKEAELKPDADELGITVRTYAVYMNVLIDGHRLEDQLDAIMAYQRNR